MTRKRGKGQTDTAQQHREGHLLHGAYALGGERAEDRSSGVLGPGAGERDVGTAWLPSGSPCHSGG